jgi:phosphonate transport system substrate-binding protein
MENPIMKRLIACLLIASPLMLGALPRAQSTLRLRLSMIPTTDPGKMIRDGQSLTTYLEKETGARIEMTIPTNYAAVVAAIANDQVDIAHFGGFTFVQASTRSGVTPLVQRTQDQSFHSLFITQPQSGINSLKDLTAGRSFAFGDVNSTSGHLMPEYYMRDAKVDLKVIEKALYSGGHDATALAVANKKIDAGAMDESVFKKMMEDGKLTAQQVRCSGPHRRFSTTYGRRAKVSTRRSPRPVPVLGESSTPKIRRTRPSSISSARRNTSAPEMPTTASFGRPRRTQDC